MGTQLDFTVAGLRPEQLQRFFAEALDASRAMEPIIESGNKYGVSSSFHAMNGELLMHQVKGCSAFQVLSEADQARAEEFFKLMFFSEDLRNRNPLHPSVLDSAVLGNLMNFPKHIFGFPFASYATNGNESLSLVLYSYRQQCSSKTPSVLYVRTAGEEEALGDIQACAARLRMQFVSVSETELYSYHDVRSIATVLASFASPSLGRVAAWAERAAIGCHVHLQDTQWRNILASNAEPVHFDLPAGIRSMTIQEGLLNCGYQLYRDARLRDLHLDVGYAWQTAYLSPNEGGSGASTPLYIDFCFVLLGWSALGVIARQGAAPNLGSGPLQPTLIGDESKHSMVPISQGAAAFDEIQSWAKCCLDQSSPSREELERYLVAFQRNFLGGKRRELEALTTGGGTRSINLAFESVLLRAREQMGSSSTSLTVLTGNPHLAVERAQRRFCFQLMRVVSDGALCPDLLKREIGDLSVVAVYTQTLSYTDGITDPLPEILEIIEMENKRRQSINAVPVTLINDSCLAFCVLVHNDGEEGSTSFRVLDLTENSITPTIVTLDAHKHLGTDKGISTVIGTPGTLSHLTGHVKVGAQPTKAELVRGLADMLLVGVEGYQQLYRDLAVALEGAAKTIESNGMTIVHARNRIKGSTVLAVEDPSAVMTRKLKKLGHSFAYLYNLCPSEPKRCQLGWSLSLTPYSLRQLKSGKPALSVFLSDLVTVFKSVQASSSSLAKMFRESSLPAILLSGGVVDHWIFGLLTRPPGLTRSCGEVLLRRFFTALLDSGKVCSLKHQAPIRDASQRFLGMLAFLALILLQVRRFVRRPRL